MEKNRENTKPIITKNPNIHFKKIIGVETEEINNKFPKYSLTEGLLFYKVVRHFINGEQEVICRTFKWRRYAKELIIQMLNNTGSTMIYNEYELIIRSLRDDVTYDVLDYLKARQSKYKI